MLSAFLIMRNETSYSRLHFLELTRETKVVQDSSNFFLQNLLIVQITDLAVPADTVV